MQIEMIGPCEENTRRKIVNEKIKTQILYLIKEIDIRQRYHEKPDDFFIKKDKEIGKFKEKVQQVAKHVCEISKIISEERKLTAWWDEEMKKVTRRKKEKWNMYLNGESTLKNYWKKFFLGVQFNSKNADTREYNFNNKRGSQNNGVTG